MKGGYSPKDTFCGDVQEQIRSPIGPKEGKEAGEGSFGTKIEVFSRI